MLFNLQFDLKFSIKLIISKDVETSKTRKSWGINTSKERKENIKQQNKKSWSDRHEETKGALALFRSIHNHPTAYVKVNGRPGRLYIRDILLNFAFTLYTPLVYIQS